MTTTTTTTPGTMIPGTVIPISNYDMSTRIITEKYGKNTILEFDCLASIGANCLINQHYIMSEKYYTKALKIGRKLFSLNDPHLIETVHSLAKVYSNQGKYDIAEDLMKQNLSLSLCNTYGNKTRFSVGILIDIGALLLKQQGYEEESVQPCQVVQDPKAEGGSSQQREHRGRCWQETTQAAVARAGSLHY